MQEDPDRANIGRPDPDALLAEARQAEAKRARGRLKVFFGMSAGVGKTYAMLEEARRRAAEGLAVLVGYAEPHIRPDTEALLLGLDLLPYRVVEYRGAKLNEFDLDAALARKPAVCCVDELAHANAPGMRHEKRWQDVRELLDACIDVYATLNVQHLESVNDVVARVTGVRVRETLPDAVLEQADKVELIDISPEELLERFHEGKVYRPEQAERAAKHFFNRGNLLALRELALRTTAQRVDAQMRDFRRDQGVRATWAVTERVLVCVGPSPLSPRLVRSAKRLADGLRAPWVAAYVETPDALRLGERDRGRVERTLRLAERLGGQVVTVRGEDAAEEIGRYARAQNVTKIVVGKPQRPRWRDAVFGSLVDDLIRGSGEIDVQVIRGEPDAADAADAAPLTDLRPTQWRGYAWAVGLVAAVTAAAFPLFHHTFRGRLASENVLMVYLLAVLWVATRHGRGAAAAASVLAVAAFDLCFVEPYLTFAVTDQQYVVTFGVMLATALTISTLTHRVRRQADAARDRELRTRTLLALSRELAAARTAEQVVASAVRHSRDVLGGDAAVWLPDADRGVRLVGPAAAAGRLAGPKEAGVAQWAFDHGQVVGRGTGTLPAAAGTYLPMAGSRGVAGVLGLTGESADGLSADHRETADAFAAQAAVAVERAVLAEEARQAWERVEAEFLRNTLLSGVSHELRTPLAAITGASTTLAEAGDALPPADRAAMLDTVVAEAARMERLVVNLLDMTRLESGGLALRREWVPVAEVIGSALRHMDNRLRGRPVRLDLPADLPLVRVDEVAVEQVLANLLDNAVEYTPPGSPIDVTASAAGDEVTVEVADRGPGLPAGAGQRVFEKFFRAAPVGQRRGIGLGLAIVRGIVEAHGGRAEAADRPGGGATFRVRLPVGGTPPKVDATS
jgi:two-component system sensor histidine kinase KdpD